VGHAVEEVISRREADVLNGLRHHLTNAEIGQRLHISVRTVESHVSSLLRKLGASDRRDLVSRAPTPAETFPPAVLRGLPSTWTAFVGRAAELVEVSRALADARLVTLVGPGGVGKTRLAVAVSDQVASTFPGPGAFVNLVPVNGDYVVEAVAAALGVVEEPPQPLEHSVWLRLRGNRTLLVLDNCEHVIAEVSRFLSSALAACPEAVVLATSRERLRVAGERVVAVPPLSLTPEADGSGSEAERLFLDRALGIDDPTSEVITEVCRRLDGLPLAIELAAARCSSLGLDGLLTGLEDALRLLSRPGHAADRHGSLRSVIEWSSRLLDDEERSVFDRLGVFAGTFDISAATAVANDGNAAATADVIGRLADKSLLTRSHVTGRSRWGMLDAIRSYARVRLEESAEQVSVRRRHLAWATEIALDLERSLGHDDDWRDRFDAVVDDLRAALGVGGATEPDVTHFDLALALGHLSYARRFLAEGREHLETAVERAPDDASAVSALRLAAHCAFAEMRGESAFDLLMVAHDRALAAGDLRAAAITLSEAAIIGGRCPGLFETPYGHDELVVMLERARSLAPPDDPEVAVYLALAAAWDGAAGPARPDPGRASEALRVARRFGDPVLLSSALDAAAAALNDEGSYKAEARLTSERLTLLEQLPRHDPRVGGEVADIFHMATESSLGAGELHLALANAERAHEDATSEGLAHFAATDLVIPLALQGSFDKTLTQGNVMLEGWERAGRPAAGWMGPAFFAVALVHGLRGDVDEYGRWWQMATDICRLGASNSFATYAASRVALHEGPIDTALHLVSTQSRHTSGSFEPYATAVSAEIHAVAGASDAAERIAACSHLVEENDFVAAQLQRAAGRLHRDRTEIEGSVARWEAIGARFERACTLVLLEERRDEGIAELSVLGCPPPYDS
jgi:predicted ATPase/DNA-binding CsgD family transcriptional regulator